MASPRPSFTDRSTKAALVLAFDALLAACLAMPGVWADVGRRNPILASLAVFVGWQAWLAVAVARRRWPAPEILGRVRSAHVLQLVCQSLVMVYWGLYYRDVYSHYYDVLIQLAFAYVLDLMLAWTLKRQWYFGFGSFPIVISTNLFLWFEHDLFWVQLAMIATGVLSKTFLTWTRDKARTHIFNPSGLPLALVSLVLLVTGNTRLARGAEFPASYELAPHIYEVIFFVGLLLNVQIRTVLLTGSAVVTTFVSNHVARLLTGRPFFALEISPPNFLGATLLFTDPATTPRSPLGRLGAGILYGLLTLLIAAFSHWLDQPGYYAKVLAVPFVNLAAPGLDVLAARLEPVLTAGAGAAARYLRLHTVHVALWIAFFVWFAPDLRETQAPLFPSPRWISASPEFEQLLIQSKVRCNSDPNLCRPFALGEELSYWLRPRR